MSIVDNILAVAGAVADQFIPGAAQFEAAAEGVVALVQGVGPILSSDDQAALAAGLDPLLAKMNVDVDTAVKDLRGP